MKTNTVVSFPEPSQFENELEREKHKDRYGRTLVSTICSLIVVAAIAVLIATIFLPVLRIYGSSMTPTLNEGEVLVALKGSAYKNGDIIAFYYSNKILVKRCIAGPGQLVDIDADGNVSVDGVLLEETYLQDGAKVLGEANIALPYLVPEGRYFVLGDNRAVIQDSRSTIVGCVSEEQVVGKVVCRVWPLSQIGGVR